MSEKLPPRRSAALGAYWPVARSRLVARAINRVNALAGNPISVIRVTTAKTPP